MTGTCRAGCGEQLDASLIEPDGDGLHPGCSQAPHPMLGELADILKRWETNTARSLQKRIGPSEIGVECDRALAYRAFGVPRAPEHELKWAPLVGTWAHDGIARALKAENKLLGRERYLIERRVPVAPELDIDGVCDCFDQDVGEVRDWKLVGKTSMATYARKGPGATYRTQAHLYGRGWENAGHDVRSVRVVFLPRWSHRIEDGHEWAEPYSRQLADDALVRLAQIKAVGQALGLPGNAQAWQTLTGSVGAACTYCPYRRRGGPADETGCPGDTQERYESAIASAAKGLIA